MTAASIGLLSEEQLHTEQCQLFHDGYFTYGLSVKHLSMK